MPAYLGDSSGWGELLAAPVHQSADEQITVLECDLAHELIWAGTESGGIYALQCPEVKRYSCFRAHNARVDDMLAATDGGTISLSAAHLRLHSPGGVLRASIAADEDAAMLACAIEPGAGNRVVVGCQNSALNVYDVATSRRVSQVTIEGVPVILRAPTARGLVAAGLEVGSFAVLDPRAGYKTQHTTAAHSAGLVAMDAKADLVATAGCGTRQGRVVAETHVKVYDVRMAPRLLTLLPFTAGPAMLRFHPAFSGTLLLASASGIFSLADAQGSSQYAQTYQVDMAGDTMVACSMASTGEALTFGGSGGYVHLWALSHQPRINSYSEPLEVPSATPQPAVRLTERDSFGLAEAHYPEEGQFLSDFDPKEKCSVGAPPRIVDPQLLSSSRKADFVTYIPNPHYRKGAPFGAATRAVAAQRAARLRLAADRPDSAAARAERRAQRAAQGGVLLPESYQYARIKQQAGTRFEAFDFSAHNATRFGGLENDLANCYTNALWQVFYFIPQLREAMLRHAVEVDEEFCLSCELGFLFRMLYAAKGQACQASNLLRALKQNREASALGLLEGHLQRGAGTADALVDLSKDTSLRRRVQSLQRFLLQQLHREAVPPVPEGEPAHASADVRTVAADSSGSTAVDALFGMGVRQRTVTVSGTRAERTQDTRTFQVELRQPQQQPPANSKSAPASPARPGSAAGTSSVPASSERDAAAAQGEAPAFGQLLADSIRGDGGTQRGWFDDVRRYQLLRQSRCPTALPQVMVVSCGMPAGGPLWWRAPSDSSAVPWALAIETEPDDCKIDVREGESAEQLLEAFSGPLGPQRAVYELSAVIAHIRDQDEPPGDSATADGHLLAHIKVSPAYLDADRGVAQSPAPPSPGQSPWPRRGGSAVANLRTTLDSAASTTAGASTAAGANPADQGSSADQAAGGADAEAAGRGDADPGQSAPAADDEGSNERASQATPVQQIRRHSSLAAAVGGLSVSTLRTISSSNPQLAQPPAQWMLFNDFVIRETRPAEVQATYAGQKTPCMLYYTRVEAEEAAATRPVEAPPPVLTFDAFQQLCLAHPLQGPHAPVERNFTPLRDDEALRPGTVFGIDAEFVALSQPDKVLQGGTGVEARAARLGLGRVSVVRGEGRLAGTPCIDDTIRSLEPVADHLTRYSGLVAGDLDPLQSRRYLTTGKQTYLKLRHLVDSGCLLVGHGLKKDFRMINIVVPPEQVVDTVELFSFKRQRKLSLRFLAAFLLRIDIQQQAHDSIEDARTALALHGAYQKLAAEGPDKLRAGLARMYDWGNACGWEPASWPQPPPDLA